MDEELLVNGSPMTQFGIERGLYQGDPLSPFLFNIMIEGLSYLFREVQDLDMMRRATFSENSVHISNLQFANDTIFFLISKMDYLLNAMRDLRCFELASDLRINFSQVLYGESKQKRGGCG
ncbi:hypothetical protein Ddye_029274 [Dipteronia dyeriana]|uniref:Reverse transcriptase domain-containing protein n=1 Tax=Dipteronia dyeriana TaxID=168575 RepID=A0AAD9TEU5_9ROSI|nr:hypothetical protein Ddye_029274 [Dipteronia dyeriana]